MKILSWNVQGIGNPWTVRSLCDWCWRERPDIVFLMETMIDSSALERVKRRCGFDNGVGEIGRNGVLVAWC